MGELVHPVVLRLIALRYRRGMSQQELARRMGTVQSAISEAERGVTSPTLTTLSRWAAALGVDIVTAPAAALSQPSNEGDNHDGA